MQCSAGKHSWNSCVFHFDKNLPEHCCKPSTLPHSSGIYQQYNVPATQVQDVDLDSKIPQISNTVNICGMCWTKCEVWRPHLRNWRTWRSCCIFGARQPTIVLLSVPPGQICFSQHKRNLNNVRQEAWLLYLKEKQVCINMIQHGTADLKVSVNSYTKYKN